MEPSAGDVLRRLNTDIKEIWEELDQIKSDIEDIRLEIERIKAAKQPRGSRPRRRVGRAFY